MPAPEHSRADEVRAAIAALRSAPSLQLVAAEQPRERANEELAPRQELSRSRTGAAASHPASTESSPLTAAAAAQDTPRQVDSHPAATGSAAEPKAPVAQDIETTGRSPAVESRAVPATAAAVPDPAPTAPQPTAADSRSQERSSESARVIAALRKAALILSHAREPVALALRRELQRETGLSMPMIEWGLVTSLASMRHAPLAELASTVPADAPPELIGVVLAGNVFVAAVRGLALPLLAGARVIAKCASGEGAFARAFQAALKQADPQVGARLAVVEFPRGDALATDALCTSVDVLSVYGSDETVEQLRQRCTSARVVAHGHGLSAAYVARGALSSPEEAARTAERIALDISAYDQHGCLSPHFVLVQPGGALQPQAFAQLLAAEAMPALAELLPPAQPSLHERAQHMQWQAAAAVRGELYVHDTHAVSFEQPPLRPSPGGRQIAVYACADLAALREQLEPFASHLKCLGVAGTKAERAAVRELLQAFCSAQVCRSGEMQAPPFDAWADGAAPLAGLCKI